jgi:hypothetical protein
MAIKEQIITAKASKICQSSVISHSNKSQISTKILTGQVVIVGQTNLYWWTKSITLRNRNIQYIKHSDKTDKTLSPSNTNKTTKPVVFFFLAHLVHTSEPH